jgi:UMP-CMP kinase
MGDKANMLFVLFFECDEETCIQRCLSRGEAGSGRSDDNLDSLKKRIKTYNESTWPIIEHYQKLGKVRKVSGCGSPEEVFASVRLVLDSLRQ